MAEKDRKIPISTEEIASEPTEDQEAVAAAGEEPAGSAAEPEPEPAPAPVAEAESPEADTGEPAPDPDARIAALEAEVAELKDKLLRALAETENVRRRAARDRQDASKYAIANFAREVLGVADNMRRALDHVDAETRGADETVETLAAGIEMTEREMLATMERFGIRPIEAMGQKFDHNVHEAMFEVEDAGVPVGTVVHELQKGYLIEDRLLRPTRVGVSRGGPSVEPPAPEKKAPKEDKAPKKQASAYEKQTDTQSEAGDGKGVNLDEEL